MAVLSITWHLARCIIFMSLGKDLLDIWTNNPPLIFFVSKEYISNKFIRCFHRFVSLFFSTNCSQIVVKKSQIQNSRLVKLSDKSIIRCKFWPLLSTVLSIWAFLAGSLLAHMQFSKRIWKLSQNPDLSNQREVWNVRSDVNVFCLCYYSVSRLL